MNPVYPDEKGVSEIIGALLLIIILVTAFAVLGAIFISQPVYEKIPAVHIQISNESKTIHIYHDGGDAIPLDKMYILVDGARLPFTIDNNADTWRIGRTLTTVSSDMPNRVDIVYQGLTSGSGIIISTLLLGVQTSQSGPTYYFTIISSANSGGSISPAGAILVASGSSQTFFITPNAGYILSDVNVDGSSLGAIPSYTFPGVNADHTISATFVPSVSNLFTINATAGPGGIISPGNMTVLFGANLTYIITPNPSYVVGSVVVNGTPVIPVPSSYTFTNVTTNHTIVAGFASNFSPGIIANYYLGQTWSVPAATNVAGRIRFADTASGAASDVTNWPVGYIGRDDNFSVNFSGYFKIDTEADYTFYLTSDDGSWLNIDGNQVINNGGLHSPAMVQQTVHLTPGYPRIFLPMFENTGGAVVWLEYSSPSIPRTFNVPLYHSPITPPTVDFTGSPLAGPAPHTVQFTDASVGATTWIWNFGDGTPVSYLQHPAHTYAAIGQYNVTLVAANTFGANTKTRLNYVLVGASFSAGLIGTYFANETWTDPGRSRTDVRIRFADSSSGDVSDEANWPTSILGQTDYFSVNWDGYLRVTTADSYTFSLRSDDGSWLWLDESQIINNGGLHGPTTVTGTVSLLPGYHHLVVRMFEHTGGAVARLQYSSPNLTLQDVSDVWHISAVPPAPVAGFSGTPLSGTVPLTVIFTDSSTNSPTSWLWNFGDGDPTNNTVQNPVHRYVTAGTYTVALTAANAGGSNIITKTGYVVVSPIIRTITASSTAGGIITPNGTISVNQGTNATFTITPNPGYNIVNVLVDGSSVGAVPGYTFTNVTADHTIVATFAIGAPSFVSITPASGPTAGGTAVTIVGTNFVSGGSFGVTIGGVAATSVVRVDSTHITAVTPAGTIGDKDVVIRNNDGQIATGVGEYTYLAPAPTVTSITPSSAVRGTTVSITNLAGTNFVVGTTPTVQLISGGNTFTASGVVVSSPTKITCSITIPGGSTWGTYNLVVINTDGQSATLIGGFTVLKSGSTTPTPTSTPTTGPTFSSITPEFGPIAGGTAVTIVGTNFVSGGSFGVTIGGVAATSVVRVDSTHITAVTPAGTLGDKDVVIRNNDGQIATGVGEYTYLAPAPTVTSITPSSAVRGTTVSITNLAGTNFVVGTTPTVQLISGGNTFTASGVVVSSPTKITCSITIPGGNSWGTYNVVVINTDGQSATLTGGFTVIK